MPRKMAGKVSEKRRKLQMRNRKKGPGSARIWDPFWFVREGGVSIKVYNESLYL